MNKTTAEKIFEIAIKLPTAQERAAYVRGACGEDQALRQQAESLIQAHEEVGGFMPTDPGETVITIPDGPLSEGEGTCIGRYKLLQKIGEGGMGVIYMAEQTEPVTRKVALKIIKLGMDTRSVIARFEAERQALAMMDHPNIAKVLDAGATDTGRPYFVMELVKGVPINQYCDKNHLPTKERLQLFMAVCQAIHHAHQKGVIHRDIKPSNILVTLHDGKPVPKVIDFGIAKATNQKLTEKTLFTHFAQMIGTPAYMSPEQAEMSGLDVDTRTDVYSLGVLLYELLTGTTPFPEKELLSKGYGEMQRIIAEQEPERPSLRVSTLQGEQQTIVAKNRSTERLALQRQIKGDLDWIVMKALEKDRTHRYDTPNNLAADIERHLSDEPVLAAQPTVLYQLGKLYRRHKVALAAAACFVLLLTVSACVSTAQAIKNKSLFTAAEEARLNEMSAKERETELRRIAETERDRSQRLLYIAHMNLAKRAWDEGNLVRFAQLLDLHTPQPGRQDLRNFEWFYLDRLRKSELLTFKGHTNRVNSVAFSPDGKWLASGSADQTVKVWDATNGRERLTLKGHTNGVRSVAFSPDGKRLASGSRDQTVKVWDASSGRETLALKGLPDSVESVAFSPDGTRLAGASGRIVKAWDAMTGQETLAITNKHSPHPGFTRQFKRVAFSPDGKQLATAETFSVTLWNATTGQELRELKVRSGPVCSIAFSPDGQWLASAGADQTVTVWDTSTGQKRLTFNGHSGRVNDVAFTPDGKRLASASDDGTVKVLDAATGEAMLTIAHSEPVISLAFFADGKRLASASGGIVRVWDETHAEESVTSPFPMGAQLSFIADGKRMVAEKGRTVQLWDIETGLQESLMLKGYSFDGPLEISTNGKWVAAQRGGTVRVWELIGGQEPLTLGHTNLNGVFAFSPDGKRLATASSDQRVRIWDATSGQLTLTFDGLSGNAGRMAFSSDGKRLATAGSDQTVRIWDAMSGQLTLTFDLPTDRFARLTSTDMGSEGVRLLFGPDGKRLAVSGSLTSPCFVCVLDTTSGQEILTLKDSTVIKMAFSPDGKWLAASASGDRTVKVWNATTGQETLTLSGHVGWVGQVAFSPDGTRLVTGSRDQTVKVWDAATGQETLTLKGHIGPVWYVAFSADGKRLASASGDMGGLTVKVWDAQPRSEASTPDAKTR